MLFYTPRARAGLPGFTSGILGTVTIKEQLYFDDDLVVANM